MPGFQKGLGAASPKKSTSNLAKYSRKKRDQLSGDWQSLLPPDARLERGQLISLPAERSEINKCPSRGSESDNFQTQLGKFCEGRAGGPSLLRSITRRLRHGVGEMLPTTTLRVPGLGHRRVIFVQAVIFVGEKMKETPHTLWQGVGFFFVSCLVLPTLASGKGNTGGAGCFSPSLAPGRASTSLL